MDFFPFITVAYEDETQSTTFSSSLPTYSVPSSVTLTNYPAPNEIELAALHRLITQKADQERKRVDVPIDTSVISNSTVHSVSGVSSVEPPVTTVGAPAAMFASAPVKPKADSSSTVSVTTTNSANPAPNVTATTTTASIATTASITTSTINAIAVAPAYDAPPITSTIEIHETATPTQAPTTSTFIAGIASSKPPTAPLINEQAIQAYTGFYQTDYVTNSI
ncbi:mucin-3A-like [Aedes albopictus]|uniref:Uncharacterized protein n=1 Tax=Aedes albopictus TaxID=7160 RepID=A0ABM1YAZ0_AEDAL